MQVAETVRISQQLEERVRTTVVNERQLQLQVRDPTANTQGAHEGVGAQLTNLLVGNIDDGDATGRLSQHEGEKLAASRRDLAALQVDRLPVLKDSLAVLQHELTERAQVTITEVHLTLSRPEDRLQPREMQPQEDDYRRVRRDLEQLTALDVGVDSRRGV